MYDFGLLIKNLREKHNYTQKYIALKLNVTPTTVSRWELNYKMPSCEKLIELAVLYNVSLDYLVGIDKVKPITINDLSDEQKDIIDLLLMEFRNITPSNKKDGLTETQINIINSLIKEFIK